MAIEIGVNYEKIKNEIMEGIMNKTIDMFKAEPVFHLCYFCRRQIAGEMHVLSRTDEANKITSQLYLDNDCYQTVLLLKDLNDSPLRN